MNPRNKAIKYTFKASLLALLISTFSCVEPYEMESSDLENALVIEATITDQMKKQEISLSRAYNFTTDTIQPETNARVFVVDDAQQRYEFQEDTLGKYVSVQPFKAVSNRKYHLEIITAEGEGYNSEEEELTQQSEIDSLYVERSRNKDGDEGVAILINSMGSQGQDNYFKYTYSETYKIKSPYRSNFDLIIDQNNNIDLVRKTKEEEICYTTKKSKDVMLENTRALQADNLQEHLIKFLKIDNKKIWFRYSIKVNQVALNREVYSYYTTLNDLSSSESVFSQNQPGYIQGNVYSVDHPDENVVGFFHVGSVDSQRIFFSFLDLFDIRERPSLLDGCRELLRPDLRDLKVYVKNNQVKFLSKASRPREGDAGKGPYRVVLPECMDCTLNGTNIKPDFWEE